MPIIKAVTEWLEPFVMIFCTQLILPLIHHLAVLYALKPANLKADKLESSIRLSQNSSKPCMLPTGESRRERPFGPQRNEIQQRT